MGPAAAGALKSAATTAAISATRIKGRRGARRECLRAVSSKEYRDE
jgi:tRNA U34 5-methylaminomethyl-2-thiouridine-forming methyltransferase MnmC